MVRRRVAPLTARTEGRIRFDQGQVHPTLVEFLQSEKGKKLVPQQGKAVVPGCGRVRRHDTCADARGMTCTHWPITDWMWLGWRLLQLRSSMPRSESAEELCSPSVGSGNKMIPRETLRSSTQTGTSTRSGRRRPM